MNIHLYLYTGEPNAFPKALGNPTIISGNLREGTSLLDPHIVIEAETVAYFNYMYIPDFNRYYFVKSKKNLNTNVWELALHVDVLETYGNRIYETECVIDRTEDYAKRNVYLNDENILVYPEYTAVNLAWDEILPLEPVEFNYGSTYCICVNTIASEEG